MATQAASPAAQPQPRSRASWFYPGMAIFIAAMIVFGFARTYYLKAFFGTPQLDGLIHLHGAIMTAWLALLIAQATLVRAGRTDIHRRLGVAGGILAAAVATVGTAVGIHVARLGHTPFPGVSPLSFLAVPLGDIFVFTVLIAAALWFRRRPQLHKRLMLVAALAILPPGLARWPVPHVYHNPLAFFGIADLVLIACVIYDYARTRRLHPAFVWGGLLLILSQPGRFLIAGTAPWMAFAHWITGV